MRKWMVFAVLCGAVICYGWILFRQPVARAAASCTATLTWASSTISKGDSAKETWTVTGATSAAGTCYDGLALNSTHSVSFGPQSYTFPNVQSPITCVVVGVTADGQSCTSGPQTFTVNSPTPPPSAGNPTCNLFPRATGDPASTHLSFPANVQMGSPVNNFMANYDWAYYSGGIEEYLSSDNVGMSPSGLPPGMSLNSRQVSYPETNMANDGIKINGMGIQDYILAHPQTGYPTLTRYRLAGAATQEGTYNVTFTAHSSACGTQTQNFTITVTPYVAPPPAAAFPNLIPAATSTNGLIQFVKTLFYNDGAPSGAQMLKSVMVWGKKGDKFVMVGEYGGALSGLPLNSAAGNAGGGLYTVQEDGSKMVERDAALDAGSGSDQIYQHGHRHSVADPHLEWSSGGFVLENASWSSCLLGGGATGYCQQSGPGANRAVFYKQGADGFPVVAGRSPAQGTSGNDLNTNMAVFKNMVVNYNDNELFSLPKWSDLGGADTSVKADLGSRNAVFGNNIIQYSGGEIFSVADDGSLTDTGQSALDSGYTTFTSAWDWSGGFPPKLAVWERAPITGSAGYTRPGDKIKVYKLAADGSVVLDKTFTAPTSTVGGSVYASNFAVWGSYVVTVDSVNSLAVWQNGQKLDTIQLPSFGGTRDISAGNIHPGEFAVSKDGYLAVLGAGSPREATAFLYKLNLTPSGGGNPVNPVNPNPGGGHPVVPQPTGNSCVDKYGPACDQIQELRKQICDLAPDLPLCSQPL